MLKLRPAIVVETDRADAGAGASAGDRSSTSGEQRLVIELAGDESAGARRAAIADIGLVGLRGGRRRSDRERAGARPRPRLGRLRRRARQPHARPGRGAGFRSRPPRAPARDEAQLHEPPACRRAGRGRAPAAAGGAAGGGARPARPAGRPGVGLRAGRAGRQARLRADRGRRAAGRALADGALAARARAARRPPDGGRGLRRGGARRSPPPARSTTALRTWAGTRPCADPARESSARAPRSDTEA